GDCSPSSPTDSCASLSTDSLTVTGGTAHTVQANYVHTGSFTDSSGSLPGGQTVDQATPTLSVTNSPVTYNGSQQSATVMGSVAGTVSNIKYNGSVTVPTNAGTYAVTADFTPNVTTNYASLTAAPAGNFAIQKVTPTLSVTNSPVTYNGSAQSATVSSGSIAGTVSNVKYNGSATVPTNAATYAVTADFTPTNTTNYTSLTAAPAGNFVIQKAASTTTFGAAPTPAYQGGNFTVSASNDSAG